MNSNRIFGLPHANSSGEPVTQGQIGEDTFDRSGDSIGGDLDIQDNWILGDSGQMNMRDGEITMENGEDTILELNQEMPGSGNPATLLFRENGSANWAFVSMQDGGLGIYDAQTGEIVQKFNENGSVEFQDNDLEVTGGKLGIGTSPSLEGQQLHIDQDDSCGECEPGIFIEDPTTGDTHGFKMVYNDSEGKQQAELSVRSSSEDQTGLIIDRDSANVEIPNKLTISNNSIDMDRNWIDFNSIQGLRITPGDTSVSNSEDNSDMEYQTDGEHLFYGGNVNIPEDSLNVNADSGRGDLHVAGGEAWITESENGRDGWRFRTNLNDAYGFNDASGYAQVLVNEQGNKNEALYLGDSNGESGADLFGISSSGDNNNPTTGDTSEENWNRAFAVKGDGTAEIGGDLDMQGGQIRDIDYPSDGAKKVIAREAVTPGSLETIGDLRNDGGSYTIESPRRIDFDTDGEAGGILGNQTIIDSGVLSSNKRYLVEIDVNSYCTSATVDCDMGTGIADKNNARVTMDTLDNSGGSIRVQETDYDGINWQELDRSSIFDKNPSFSYRQQFLVEQDGTVTGVFAAQGYERSWTYSKSLDLSNGLEFHINMNQANIDDVYFEEADIRVYEISETEEVMTK